MCAIDCIRQGSGLGLRGSDSDRTNVIGGQSSSCNRCSGSVYTTGNDRDATVIAAAVAGRVYAACAGGQEDITVGGASRCLGVLKGCQGYVTVGCGSIDDAAAGERVVCGQIDKSTMSSRSGIKLNGCGLSASKGRSTRKRGAVGQGTDIGYRCPSNQCDIGISTTGGANRNCCRARYEDSALSDDGNAFACGHCSREVNIAAADKSGIAAYFSIAEGEHRGVGIQVSIPGIHIYLAGRLAYTAGDGARTAIKIDVLGAVVAACEIYVCPTAI